MPTGTVKWFNETKGFGFIKPDDGGADLFAHYSGIKSKGFRTLKENQKVEYQVQQGQKGPQAVEINVLEQPEVRSDAACGPAIAGLFFPASESQPGLANVDARQHWARVADAGDPVPTNDQRLQCSERSDGTAIQRLAAAKIELFPVAGTY